MKIFNLIAGTATLLWLALSLSGCGRTSNSSGATNAAAMCTRNYNGMMTDQFGRPCGTGFAQNNCGNARYINGQYFDATTGQPLSCGTNFYDGYNSVPYYGQYNGQNFSGCQGWSQYYPGNQYIPIDIGYGQMVCMNVSYLYQYNPGYNWNQMYNNYSMYGYPMYTCMYGGCGGGYYGGYTYGCQAAINLGFNFGYGGMGFGMCF